MLNSAFDRRAFLIGVLVSQQFTENLRYLLWQQSRTARRRRRVDEHGSAARELGDDRQEWLGLAMTWIGCDRARACELILGKGRPAELDEMNSVAVRNNHELEMIANHRLLKPPEILCWNIDYLFAGLPHGARGQFAQAIGIDVSTISRWRRGVARPTRNHITILREQFALDVGTDLESQPLFLSPTPVSMSQRRDWLKRRIDRMSPRELNELFPALHLLLGGDHAGD